METDYTQPNLSVLVKLGSIAVHAEEFLGIESITFWSRNNYMVKTDG